MNESGFKTIEGGCLCGTIRYRITRSPLRASYCHCRNCQLAGGAPVVSWLMVPADAFELLAGEPGDFRSSPEGMRQFCRSCGTQLTFRHVAAPDVIDVTGASLDDPDTYPPQYSIWSSSRRSYTSSLDSTLPIFEENRKE